MSEEAEAPKKKGGKGKLIVIVVAALLLGAGFGFCLERAGFGSARKLVAVFYLYDMAVVKVMFIMLRFSGTMLVL